MQSKYSKIGKTKSSPIRFRIWAAIFVIACFFLLFSSFLSQASVEETEKKVESNLNQQKIDSKLSKASPLPPKDKDEEPLVYLPLQEEPEKELKEEREAEKEKENIGGLEKFQYKEILEHPTDWQQNRKTRLKLAKIPGQHIWDVWFDRTEGEIVLFGRVSRISHCVFNENEQQTPIIERKDKMWSARQEAGGEYACKVPDTLYDSEEKFVTVGFKSSGEVVFEMSVKVPAEQEHDKRNFKISAVLVNRVFKEDQFNITHREVRQWIAYMMLAGVEHFYLYDNCKKEQESLFPHLKDLVQKGYLTYNSWIYEKGGGLGGYQVMQDSAYTHNLQRYKHENGWQVQMDVDEYPVLLSDKSEGWLSRWLDKKNPDSVSVYTVYCMFYGDVQDDEGTRKQSHHEKLMIEAYKYRERRVVTAGRFKPIYWAKHVSSIMVHMVKGVGRQDFVSEGEMRFNHYWGFRCEDCNVYDNTMDHFVEPLKKKIREIDEN